MNTGLNQTNFEMIFWNENLMKKLVTQRGHLNKQLWSGGVCPTYPPQYHTANNESNWRCIFNCGPDLTDDRKTIYLFFFFSFFFFILRCEILNGILTDVRSSAKVNFTLLDSWWKIKWWNGKRTQKACPVKWSRIPFGNCVLFPQSKEQRLVQDRNHQHRSANSVFDQSKYFLPMKDSWKMVKNEKIEWHLSRWTFQYQLPLTGPPGNWWIK